jgi:hypothetical protein
MIFELESLRRLHVGGYEKWGSRERQFALKFFRGF